MRARRTFTKEFKKDVVELVVSGKASQLEISRKYSISPVVISRWKVSLPVIVGHEISGEVVDIGDNIDKYDFSFKILI